MLINLLFTSPQMFAILALAIVYALTIHEFAHALAANYLGDATAKYNGRLSLNPLAHLEFFGTLMLLVAGFGWGKPVPVNPYNLRWRKWGDAAVSLAGPLVNFLSVIIFVLVFKALTPFLPGDNLLFLFLSYLILINITLGVFNLIPIPPLDGSKILFTILPSKFDDFKRKLAINGPWILIILIILDNFLNVNIFGRLFSYFIKLIDFFI
jgi:Zn-dependent protease